MSHTQTLQGICGQIKATKEPKRENKEAKARARGRGEGRGGGDGTSGVCSAPVQGSAGSWPCCQTLTGRRAAGTEEAKLALNRQRALEEASMPGS